MPRDSAITLHPKPAFLEWLERVAKQHPLRWNAQQLLLARESVAWIVPSPGAFDSSAHFQLYLESLKPGLLRSELGATTSSEGEWPEISAANFDLFFEIQVHPHVARVDHSERLEHEADT
jgi:hypothetical protein